MYRAGSQPALGRRLKRKHCDSATPIPLLRICLGGLYPVAFYGAGIIPDDKLPTVMLAQFVTKVGVEVLFTPATYLMVARLKKTEQEDFYDRDTNFTPCSLI